MSLSPELQTAIRHFLAGTASETERQLVDDWYYSFNDEVIGIPVAEADFREAVRSRIRGRLGETLGLSALQTENADEKRTGRRVPQLVSGKNLRWAAAAVFIGLLGTGGWWMLRTPIRSVTPSIAAMTITDVAPPAGNRATLTLGNGQKLYIDSMGNGQLAVQGGIRITKTAGGRIDYVSSGGTGEVLMNTLTNPRGSQIIAVTLSDGTKVWLNAESSIRYPAVFTGKERWVEMTGEAYFEVARNAAQPFHVRPAGGMEIAVLGTSFDVNAYGDEGVARVTLLEGSVRVRAESTPAEKQGMLLKPGQQADLAVNASTGKTQDLQVYTDVDLEVVMAWKNGMQSFNNADVRTLMRQIQRWYDVEIAYEGSIPQRQFTGEIPRSANLSEVLKLLTINHIHYTLDARGRKLTVRP